MSNYTNANSVENTRYVDLEIRRCCDQLEEFEASRSRKVGQRDELIEEAKDIDKRKRCLEETIPEVEILHQEVLNKVQKEMESLVNATGEQNCRNSAINLEKSIAETKKLETEIRKKLFRMNSAVEDYQEEWCFIQGELLQLEAAVEIINKTIADRRNRIQLLRATKSSMAMGEEAQSAEKEEAGKQVGISENKWLEALDKKFLAMSATVENINQVLHKEVGKKAQSSLRSVKPGEPQMVSDKKVGHASTMTDVSVKLKSRNNSTITDARMNSKWMNRRNLLHVRDIDDAEDNDLEMSDFLTANDETNQESDETDLDCDEQSMSPDSFKDSHAYSSETDTSLSLNGDGDRTGRISVFSLSKCRPGGSRLTRIYVRPLMIDDLYKDVSEADENKKTDNLDNESSEEMDVNNEAGSLDNEISTETDENEKTILSFSLKIQSHTNLAGNCGESGEICENCPALTSDQRHDEIGTCALEKEEILQSNELAGPEEEQRCFETETTSMMVQTKSNELAGPDEEQRCIEAETKVVMSGKNCVQVDNQNDIAEDSHASGEDFHIQQKLCTCDDSQVVSEESRVPDCSVFSDDLCAESHPSDESPNGLQMTSSGEPNYIHDSPNQKERSSNYFVESEDGNTSALPVDAEKPGKPKVFKRIRRFFQELLIHNHQKETIQKT